MPLTETVTCSAQVKADVMPLTETVTRSAQVKADVMPLTETVTCSAQVKHFHKFMALITLCILSILLILCNNSNRRL